jgi:2'-hydroxyisoflavone reductase
MNLLFIGGTGFFGRHAVDAALAAGHRVTLFHRGTAGVEPRPNVTHLLGDRRLDLAALRTGDWDAVIDTCGYLPREVVAMAEQLRGRVRRYVFISSVSTYASFAMPNDEASPLGQIADVDTEVVDGRTYGPLKALCEQALRQRFGEQALLIRPGLVVGPGDTTGRFTWWPARVARAADGEAVLAPAGPQLPVQFIDVRDLAAFVLHTVAQGISGPVNVASAPGARTLGDVLETCAKVARRRPRWVWVRSEWLLAQNLQPWTTLPLWLPEDGEYASFMRVDTSRAQALGLTVRPLADTVRDTLSWWQRLPEAQQAFPTTGLAPERERALLAQWAACGS